MKCCTKCGASKPEGDFHRNKSTGGVRPQCKQCAHAAALAWRKRNLPRAQAAGRRSQRRRKLASHGLTEEDYAELLRRSNGLCEICGGSSPGKALAIDHCHRTGVVRGLLCDICNLVLGMMNDDPSRLRSAANYVEAIRPVEEPALKAGTGSRPRGFEALRFRS